MSTRPEDRTEGFNKANWSIFENKLNYININAYDLAHTPDSLNAACVKAMIEAVKSAVPLVKSKSFKPEIPPLIIDLIRSKRKLRRKLIKNSNLTSEYNQLTKLIKQAFFKFRNGKWFKFTAECGDYVMVTRGFWRRINRFRVGPERVEIATLRVEGVSYQTDTEKADIFATHLANTFSNNNPSANFDAKHKRRH